MKRRIFVAIVLSGDLQNDILRHEEKWQRLPVRWLDGKNLHITLVPPWYGENIDKVIAQLKTVGQFGKAINIEFQRVCYGPSRAIVPNVIWAEGKESEELLGLKRKIESVLGARPEQREFKPHITLARFRPEDFPRFPVKKLNEVVSWHETVNSFVLMESHGNSEYEILAEFKI